jgi:hypothetical protein
METDTQPTTPEFKDGLTVEHILLSVTVTSTSKIIQYDDSCSHILRKELKEYHDVVGVRAEVLGKHTRIETHSKGCECGDCTNHLLPSPL